MSDKPRSYEIRTVGDFLDVPPDRQAACLVEFSDFLDLSREVKALCDSLSESLGVAPDSRVEAFMWVDDGRRDRAVELAIERADGEDGK